MNETLAQAIQPEWVSTEQLDDDYRPVLKMVRELIGVIPNCNPVLEIWPTGFRTFNLLVPNLLNLPAALVGQGAPKDLVGIAMYSSSNAAGCPYCTAHHCSFAIRRGADPDAVLGKRTEAEAAVANLAEAMAVVPARVTKAHIEAVEAHLSDTDIEWIVLAVGLGGFLNKFMDTMGIQLEEDTVADVQAMLRPTGWDPTRHLWTSEEVAGQSPEEGRPLSAAASGWTEVDRSDEIPVDSIATYLRVFRQAPGAVRLEKAWTKGVSGRIGPTLLMLEEEIGYAFPILGAITSTKVVKAIATGLRDNLDAEVSRIGLKAKLLAGMVYAGGVGNELLLNELAVVAEAVAPGIDPRLMAATRRFAKEPAVTASVPHGLSIDEAAALLLAKAASSSPAEVSEITVATVSPTLDADEIVELVVFLSLLQTLARLYSFYEVRYPALEDEVGEAVEAHAGNPSGSPNSGRNSNPAPGDDPAASTVVERSASAAATVGTLPTASPTPPAPPKRPRPGGGATVILRPQTAR
jgi:alkylhydroperoxidase family enzyme